MDKDQKTLANLLIRKLHTVLSAAKAHPASVIDLLRQCPPEPPLYSLMEQVHFLLQVMLDHIEELQYELFQSNLSCFKLKAELQQNSKPSRLPSTATTCSLNLDQPRGSAKLTTWQECCDSKDGKRMLLTSNKDWSEQSNAKKTILQGYDSQREGDRLCNTARVREPEAEVKKDAGDRLRGRKVKEIVESSRASMSFTIGVIGKTIQGMDGWFNQAIKKRIKKRL